MNEVKILWVDGRENSISIFTQRKSQIYNYKINELTNKKSQGSKTERGFKNYSYFEKLKSVILNF